MDFRVSKEARNIFRDGSADRRRDGRLGFEDGSSNEDVAAETCSWEGSREFP
jgi:hypothetical protein